MRLKALLIPLLLVFAAAAPACAQTCQGRDLIQALPPARLDALQAASRKVPFHQGLFWRASKGDSRILLLGTYHFDDPRHGATLAQFGPELARADALLVEAGPVEEAALAQAMTSDPALIMDADGPTLPERMTAPDWQALSAAMEARGMPAVITSRLRPWYVSVMLGISPCMIRAMKETGDAGGLDHRLIRAAEAADVPVRALEPWDTVFKLFGDMTPAEEIDMLRAAMPAAEYADDYAVTLTDAYFSGESWLIWEFGRFDAYDRSGMSRAEVDEQMRLAQEKLMDRRNESWVPVIESAARAAAARDKGIVVGFGALHLPGGKGVLSLLGQRGWTISPVEPLGGGTGDDG
ncbi:MAG: TraB/GumN family protein [Paracoccus sp. (in: a-proteobacteria)]|uniref:TraB/GumN family protein n=1 Tax=Paracoccus sp. TaxID=267 RepID=UPI0039E68996